VEDDPVNQLIRIQQKFGVADSKPRTQFSSRGESSPSRGSSPPSPRKGAGEPRQKENRNDAENSKKLREENSKNDNRQRDDIPRDRTRDDRRDSRRDDRRRFEDDRPREDNRIDDSRAVDDRYDEYAREEEERRRGRGDCNRMCDLLIFDIYQSLGGKGCIC